MKVLVAGYGLIGRAAALACASDTEVCVLDRAPDMLDCSFQAFQVDLLDPSATRSALLKLRPDVLVYAAGEVGGMFAHDPVRVATRSVMALKHVLLAAQVAGSVRHVVLCSSLAVYDLVASTLPIREEAPGVLRPRSPYGQSKLMLERVLFQTAPILGASSVILRFAGVYGSEAEPGGGWMHQTLHAALVPLRRGTLQGVLPRALVGNEYLHVEDAARAIQLAVQAQGSPVVCNIGPGYRYDAASLQREVQQLFPSTDVTVEEGLTDGREDPGLELRPHLDINLARTHFGFEPMHPRLSTGLRAGAHQIGG